MDPRDKLINPEYFDMLLSYSTHTLIFSYISVFIFYRYASKILFNKDAGSILRVLEFPLTFIFNLITITVPTFVIAAFKVMLNKNEYNCAEKKISTTSSTISTPLQL